MLAGLLTVSVPAHGAFPGANGRIVYATEFSNPSQIYTMRPDGAGLRQLTHLSKGHKAKHPEWSPDGTKIIYVKDNQIWVMNADGTGKTRLTNVAGFKDADPSWSPDGSKIVFSHCDFTFGFKAYCDIDAMNADGTGLTTILDDNWINDNPAYSPDGSTIAFSSTRGGYVCAVWVMKANGSNPTRLTDPAMQANGPEWSPDGTQLLFGTNCERPGSQAWVMNADGSGQQQLTPAEGDWVNPQYSPDGQTIAVLGPNVQHPNVCCWDLYYMNPDGTNLHLIPNGHRGIIGFDWGPKAAMP
jgi:TolB protein